EGLQDHRQRQRRDGEKDSLQAQGQIANPQTQKARDQTASQQLHEERRLVGTHEKGGHVGSQGKEGGRAKIHIASVTAQDVPGGGQHDVLQDDVGGKVKVSVLHETREQQS